MELVRYFSAEFTTLAETPETKKSPSTKKNFFQLRSITACSPSPPFLAMRRLMKLRVTSMVLWIASSIASLLVIEGTTMRRMKARRFTKTASTAAPRRRGSPFLRCSATATAIGDVPSAETAAEDAHDAVASRETSSPAGFDLFPVARARDAARLSARSAEAARNCSLMSGLDVWCAVNSASDVAPNASEKHKRRSFT